MVLKQYKNFNSGNTIRRPGVKANKRVVNETIATASKSKKSRFISEEIQKENESTSSCARPHKGYKWMFKENLSSLNRQTYEESFYEEQTMCQEATTSKSKKSQNKHKRMDTPPTSAVTARDDNRLFQNLCKYANNKQRHYKSGQQQHPDDDEESTISSDGYSDSQNEENDHCDPELIDHVDKLTANALPIEYFICKSIKQTNIKNNKGKAKKRTESPNNYEEENVVQYTQHNIDNVKSLDTNNASLNKISKDSVDLETLSKPVSVSIEKTSVDVNRLREKQFFVLETATTPRQLLIDVSPALAQRLGYENATTARYLGYIVLQEEKDCKNKLFRKYQLRVNKLQLNKSIKSMSHIKNRMITLNKLIDVVIDCWTYRWKAEDTQFVRENITRNYSHQMYLNNDLKTFIATPILTPKRNIEQDTTAESYLMSTEHQIFEDTTCSTEIFCPICTENMKSTEHLFLDECGHTFCTDCWRQHLIYSIKNGANHLYCPDVGCKSEVDEATILAMVPLRIYLQHLLLKDHLVATQQAQICPNSNCNRLLKLSIETNKSMTSLAPVVQCICQTVFCSLCRGPGHWPATCETAQLYLTVLRSNRDDKDMRFREPMLKVEGKRCPKCALFIEKDGGCHHMTCCCGHHFCWNCKKDLTHNPYGHNTEICGNQIESKRFKEIQHYHKEDGVPLPKQNDDTQEIYRCCLELRNSNLGKKAKLKRNETKRMLTEKRMAEIMQKDPSTQLNFGKLHYATSQEIETYLFATDELGRILEYIGVSLWYMHLCKPSNRLSSTCRDLKDHYGRINMNYQNITKTIERYLQLDISKQESTTYSTVGGDNIYIEKLHKLLSKATLLCHSAHRLINSAF